MTKLNLLKGTTLALALSFFGLETQAQDMSKAQETTRFSRPVNTGANHTLLILDTAWGELTPEVGDEIAAYDKTGNMVASIAYVGHHTGIALWGDDEYTSEKEGLATGEVFSLKWWKKSSNEMVTINMSSFERGGNSYIKDGLTVVSSIEFIESIDQTIELFQNVPNPVTDYTTISFYLPEESEVLISLHNNLGQEVSVLSKGLFTTGTHTIDVNTEKLQAGVYFYNLSTSKEKITKQLTIIK
jgi:hypothetical protein